MLWKPFYISLFNSYLVCPKAAKNSSIVSFFLLLLLFGFFNENCLVRSFYSFAVTLSALDLKVIYFPPGSSPRRYFYCRARGGAAFRPAPRARNCSHPGILAVLNIIVSRCDAKILISYYRRDPRDANFMERKGTFRVSEKGIFYLTSLR